MDNKFLKARTKYLLPQSLIDLEPAARVTDDPGQLLQLV